MKRKLIVNADDFGLTSEINQGIIKVFREGILTSVSLVASGEAFEEAVALIHQHPTLDVGVHLTLTGEKSVLPSEDIPTLVNTEGYFRKSVLHFICDYLLNRINMDEVRRELRAQMQRIRQSGISLSHIDSHEHFHILPEILPIVVQLAHEFRINAIRAPLEQIKWSNFLLVYKWPRLIKQLGFNFFFQRIRYCLNGCTPDYFFGFFDSGHLNMVCLARIISQLPTGVSELMCHPGLGGGRSKEKYAHWRYSWRDEYCILKHQSIFDLISRQKVMLTSFQSEQSFASIKNKGHYEN